MCFFLKRLLLLFQIQLNDDYYECLTPKTTIKLLEACKKGSPPKMGKWGSLPMNGQISCEGPQGKTSLHEVPPGRRFKYIFPRSCMCFRCIVY